MIGEMILGLLLAKGIPAAEPSFAFLCRLEGAFEMENPKAVAYFPKRRPLAFLVKRAGNSALTPSHTFDPTSALGGRQIQALSYNAYNTLAYRAVTSLRDANSPVLNIIPTESVSHNEWAIAIGQLGTSRSVVGKCLLNDGVSEAAFESLVKSIRQKMNPNGELE